MLPGATSTSTIRARVLDDRLRQLNLCQIRRDSLGHQITSLPDAQTPPLHCTFSAAASRSRSGSSHCGSISLCDWRHGETGDAGIMMGPCLWGVFVGVYQSMGRFRAPCRRRYGLGERFGAVVVLLSRPVVLSVLPPPSPRPDPRLPHLIRLCM
ncbi:uncharacterized protein YALI1_F14207g [Yarrowia lipolytica]|uniref:Uncharacterized protein n=1 Tax=Yarrowia lipolytica TaxID=4952 RepID=A0A1D8NMT4_YARLL|nr:hypothetical protein YALI1_F14207g [Yarrowia lipolytica]